MCEYCGCQSIAAIAALTLEHDEALDHARTARTALQNGDLDEVREACRRLAELLATHTAVEEQGLFPPMREAFPEQIDALHREHETIDAALAEVAGVRQLGWDSRLIEALDLLARHILKEQDGVFPAALTTLSALEWDRLDALRGEPVGTIRR